MHLFKTKRGKIGHALQLNQYAESDIILVAKVLLLKINLTKAMIVWLLENCERYQVNWNEN